MRQVLQLDAAEVAPENARVLRSQGMPEEGALPVRLRGLLDSAAELFRALAEPRGVLERVTQTEFDRIFWGEGDNEPDSPLQEVYPKAAGLALFAATVGQKVSRRIKELFADGDLAQGYMLDAAASVAADSLGTSLGLHFGEMLTAEGSGAQEAKVLPYSPGYCGWSIKGQRKLFERLRPADVGIELNGSFLMEPLKSVSGVLVAGPGGIHKFRAAFPFCEACRTHSCRERMASVLRAVAPTEQHQRRQGSWRS